MGERVPVRRIRARGTGGFLYLLLCQVGEIIFVKAGRSRDPVHRLPELLTGCRVVPQLLAIAELPTHGAVCRAEAALHRAFKPWRSQGEWFAFDPSEREAFNQAWRTALAEFGSPSWPVKWTKLNVPPILHQRRQRRIAYRKQFTRRGRAFQDFSQATRLPP